MKKEYIIPVFVPNIGCPKNCIFCDQKSISGQKKMVTEEEVRKIIDEHLANFKENDVRKEIAFYGGSFTAISEEIQEKLLAIAYEYIQAGKVDSIRISTRPDAIDKAILKRLKKYKVKTIELGVQSANNYILKRCQRGHSFEDVKKASRMIRWHGFKLGHQMMVGLPESTKIDELNTAKELAKLKPKMMRIYPVLVIKGTKLAEEYEKGEYEPLTVVQAVERCKELTSFFKQKHISVIRIALQNTEEITDPEADSSNVIAGPYHAAFRQLVEAGLWYDQILEKIKKFNVKVKEVEIRVNPMDVNNVIGHKKENIHNLQEIYDVAVKLVQDQEVKPGRFEIKILKTYQDFLEERQKEEITK